MDEEGQVSNQENVGPKNELSGRITGNKISERIKAMQNGIGMNDETDEVAPAPKTPIKLNVSVKNLALNLNINPLALRVGAKPPKPRQNELEPILDLDKQANDVFSGPNTDSSLEPIAATGTSPPTVPPKPKHDDEMTDSFIETIKARVKIQQKRRPPSNRILKSLPIDEEAKKVELEDSEEDAEIAYPMLGVESESLNPESSESEEKENVEPNKEKDTKGVADPDSATLAALTVTGKHANEKSLGSRENTEEQTPEDPNSLLFYIIPVSIFRNLGWVITVAASLIILLLIPILLEVFINAKEGNLPK